MVTIKGVTRVVSAVMIVAVSAARRVCARQGIAVR
jgi:hypothetical protein